MVDSSYRPISEAGQPLTGFAELPGFAPCYADLEYGVAYFDGLFIRTDSFRDPRYDRVIPILPEEQILICREMLPLLRQHPGGRVLDVGTGSGVLGLWAAKNGCRVLALDVNPRALALARQNAEVNGIRVYDQVEAMDGPGVCFRQQRFDDTFEGGPFDFVFLMPPYHPTCPGRNPAVHAEAGEDGQRVFHEELQPVPRALREGGWLIANQFTTVHDGVPDVVGALQRAFASSGTSCHGTFVRILEDIETKPMLEGFYASLLDPTGPRSSDAPSAESVAAYVERVSDQHPHFGLINYEVQKGGEAKIEERPLWALPTDHPWRWDWRIWIHRMVTDHQTQQD